MASYYLAKIWPARNWPHDRDRLEIVAKFPTAKLAVRACKQWTKRIWERGRDFEKWFHPVAIKMWDKNGLGDGSFINLPDIPQGNYGRLDLELDLW